MLTGRASTAARALLRCQGVLERQKLTPRVLRLFQGKGWDVVEQQIKVRAWFARTVCGCAGCEPCRHAARAAWGGGPCRAPPSSACRMPPTPSPLQALVIHELPAFAPDTSNEWLGHKRLI